MTETRIRVRFHCPTCSRDKAIASTWCWFCFVERAEWVKVERAVVHAQ